MASVAKALFDKFVVDQEMLNKSPEKPNSDDNKPYPIVIGAGFGRTGTTSLKLGLNELGYKCYHMTEVFINGNELHRKIWHFLYEEKMKLKSAKKITSFDQWDEIKLDNEKYGKYFETLLDDKHYTASVDWPSCILYLEIMEYYKQKGIDFKVLLSIRDSGEKWWKSYHETIGQAPAIFGHWLWRAVPGMTYHNKLSKIIFDLPFDDGRYLEKDHVISKYDEWIESVKKFVPKDQLIIYSVKTGWNPLCQPLKLDIPESFKDKPDQFIRSNDSKELKKNILRIRRIMIGANIIAALVILLFVYFVINRFI